MPPLARSVVLPLLVGAQVMPRRGSNAGVIVHARLIAVAQARAQRQALPDADVVLEVRADARVEEAELRIADAARVEQRRAGLERGEAG